MFRFADSDFKSMTKAIRMQEEDLLSALRNSVPGLVGSTSETTVQNALSAVGTDDRVSTTGSHRVLIKPDAFHVSLLFQPSLAFLDRVVEVLPNGLEPARASSQFLDEFVLSVYIPHLDDKVSNLFHMAVSGTSPLFLLPGMWDIDELGYVMKDPMRSRKIRHRRPSATNLS